MSQFPPSESEHRDASLLSRLEGVPVRPIFVMGLHRSGTTFLYDSLNTLLPVAPLTVYDILFYRRLLSNHDLGRTASDQAALDAHLRSLGLKNRQIDDVPLGHATVEEYGFLLGKYAGTLKLKEKSQPLFEEMCRKLMHLTPDARAVLLKNPWDTEFAPEILRFAPEAKFVYISRDPLRTLNSQFKAGLAITGPNPYLMMLLQQFGLGERVVRFQQFSARLAGKAIYTRLMFRHLCREMCDRLDGYTTALDALPTAKFVEVRYETLIRNPTAELRRVIEFLGLEPVASPETIEPRPRVGPLHPFIQARREHFEALLARRGLTGQAR